jgi:RNA polymerase sigma-70 factor (ECF subfamily)
MAAEPQQNRQPAPTRLSESDVGRWLDEHGDVLFCFARDRVRRREDAEDIVQEAFLAAIQAFASYEGRASERTWLLSILRRKIVDFYRRSRDPFCDVADDGSPRSDSVRERYFTKRQLWRQPPGRWRHDADVLESRELAEALDRCVDRLPRSLASAFVLRELDGMVGQTICQELALSQGALRVRPHRARLLLRECLGRFGFGKEVIQSTEKRAV